jgi:hypothetical protein
MAFFDGKFGGEEDIVALGWVGFEPLSNQVFVVAIDV